MGERVFIVWDGHSLVYRTWFGNIGQFERDPDSEGLFAYSLIKQMTAASRAIEVILKQDYNVSRIRHLICWDHPMARNQRRAIYSEYKGDRNDDGAKVTDWIPDLRKEFTAANSRFGFMWYEMEADDLIALLALAHTKTLVVPVTRDEDMSQLLEHGNVPFVYDPFEKEPVTWESYIEKRGYSPVWKPLCKATVGDKSDNWKGIHRFGEKAFAKLVKEHGNHLAAEDALLTGEHADTVKLGLRLCTLPWEGIPYKEIISAWVPLINADNQTRWDSYVERYGINSMTPDDIENWLF